MKKLLIILALTISVSAYAQRHCAPSPCCHTDECEGIDIPVYIVDGVEVQNIAEISSEDIESVEIIKDPEIIRIFSPRVGGVVLITTKSKKFLTPILENYNKMSEEARQQRIPGQLLIR